MEKTLEDIQLELEQEQVDLGIARYRKEVDKAMTRKQASQLKPHRDLLIQSIYALSDELKECIKPKKGGVPLALHLIKGQDIDTIAYVVSNEIINSMVSEPTYQQVAMSITRAIKDYIQMKDFKEKCRGLHTYALDQISTGNVKHRRNAMRHYANFGGIKAPEVRDSMQIGRWFLDKFISCTTVVDQETGEIKSYLIKIGKRWMKKKTIHFIEVSQQTLKWLDKRHSQYEGMLPSNMPMVIPPLNWTDGTDGGYLVNAYPLIKRASLKHMLELNEKYLLNRVYKAVNAIQNTAWKINTDVLSVLNHFYEENISTCLVKGLYQEPEPEKPCEDTSEAIAKFKVHNEDAWNSWKTAKHLWCKEKAANVSHKSALKIKRDLANKFKDFEALYFPHNCDFRGRVYPLVPLLNPQADDLGKSLLHFAYGVPMGEHGDRWLKIHMANTFGNDKISLDERVKWAEDNEVAFLLIAKDPLSHRSMWENTDSPWQYLAACFEYAKYKASNQGKDFISTLNVGLDGSCNGIQHLASLVKDKVSGAQVNLVPSETPSDVYQEVCDVVNETINKQNDTYSNFWRGKVTRKIVKQPVMTVAYGATSQGMQDQVRDAIKKMEEKGQKVMDIPTNLTKNERKQMEWEAICFIAKEIEKAIDQVLIGPRKTMTWLKSLAKQFNKKKQFMVWVSPIGFPVEQNYLTYKSVRLDTNLGNERIQLRVRQQTSKLDAVKIVNGFSPNLVHSYDSSHLMSTVNRLQDLGVEDFSMVHDSFATHLGHAQELRDVLRLTFIEQYRGNVIESVRQELQENIGQSLPEPDQPGHLDITRVMESDYFFN